VIIELAHETDPRYLLSSALPQRVTMEDLGNQTYGKPLIMAPGPVDYKYESPEPGVWVRPQMPPEDPTGMPGA
jgi:hypothetical protein